MLLDGMGGSSRVGKTCNKIKRDLSEVVQTIARYEPVRVLAPRGRGYREARREFAACPNVTVIDGPVDDFWMRDIMPTFALRGEGPRRKLSPSTGTSTAGAARRPAAACRRPARQGGRPGLRRAARIGAVRRRGRRARHRRPRHHDHDAKLPAQSQPQSGAPWLRSPAHDRKELGKLGIRQVIWLEGDPCEPITSGHTDGYVLCAPGGVVLVEAIDDEDIEPPLWRGHDIALLENARDADGRKLKVVRVLRAASAILEGRSRELRACYLNAYVANGAVISARFGDAKRDEAARKALAKAFPGREIVMLQIDAIAEGGGGVHCLTQPMPIDHWDEAHGQ